MKARFGHRWKDNHTALFFLLSYLLIMAIPLAVNLGFDYPSMREMLIDNARERAQAASARVAESLDTQLTQILSLPEYIFKNKRIMLRDVMHSPLNCKTAYEELALMLQTNTFIDQLYLYIRDSDYLISARSNSFYLSDMELYSGVYETSFANWSVNELRDKLMNVDSQTTLPAQPVTIGGKLYPQTLMFLAPVPAGRYAKATMMACVNASHFRDMAAENGQQFIGMTFDPNNVLMCVTEALPEGGQADIVQRITQSPSGSKRLTLAGSEYILAWTRSRSYGWVSARLIPMAAILSETSALQNRAMLITLLVTGLCLALIMLAMRFNYIPIRRLAQMARDIPSGEPQNDFSAIRHLITTLTHQNDTLERRLDITEPQAREALISQLFGGDEQERALAIRRASLFGVDLAHPAFDVLLAEYADAESADNACARLNAEAPEGFVLVQRDVRSQIALLVEPDTFEVQRVPLTDAARLAYGTRVSQASQIGLSYSAARATLDYMHMLGLPAREMRCEELPERAFNPRSYPLEVMQSLDTAISHGNTSRFLELITQLESLIALEGAPPYFTRSVYFNTVNLLMGGLARHLGDANPTVEALGMQSMLRDYSVPEMVEILHAISEQLTRLMQENAARYTPMSKSLDFIDQNLSSCTLCLQAAADYVGMSPSAFSRAFKERVGRNFKEYVDAARVIRAQDLLCQTDKPIEQIALAVGYDTLTSFYRLFKKVTGVAPGEYRQINQHSDLEA